MINLYKKVGETPKEALDRLRISRPDLGCERLSYAGRLDPLAEGVLPIMVGSENDTRDDYLYLPKTYEADIIFSIDTDTHDELGLVISMEPTNFDEEHIKKDILPRFMGAFSQAYPAYSSKTVNGEPLFLKARRGERVELPTHEVFVKKIEVVKFFHVNAADLFKDVLLKVHSVRGDFRQKEIENSWSTWISNVSMQSFHGITVVIEASSGFYVRALARDIGKALGPSAIASRILRTRVGDMRIEDSILR